MNITESILDRINKRLTETKNPCSTYKTYEAANKVGAEKSIIAGNTFDMRKNPCRYLVLYIPSMQRWTPVFDFTELFMRKSATGGFVGILGNFYTF